MKAFLFDLDGTIWNSENAIAQAIKNTIYDVKGRSITTRELLSNLRENRMSPLDVLRSHGVVYNKHIYWRHYRDESDRVELFFKDTEEVFEKLLKKNKSIGFITHLKKEFTMKQLDNFDLTKFADVIITPSECRTYKPNPEPLNMALKAISTKSKDAIYVGDQDIDILAAKNCGCSSGHASWSNNNSLKEEPDYSFKDIYEILNFI